MTSDGWLGRGKRLREQAGEVCVFIRCHRHLIATPSGQVERLMLADEITRQVTVTPKTAPAEGVAPNRTVVMVAAQPYAAWDLGRMLGLTPLAAAWVLVRVPFLGGTVPMALRTGPCLAVQALRASAALPLGAFRGRRQALARAFLSTDVAVDLKDSPVGLLVNLTKLWTPSELEASAAAVAEVEATASATAVHPRSR